MAFAEKLIAVRRAHHLTQEQLAAKLFVTRQAVSRWERGEVTPGIDMMKLIAAVTGEPLSHLLEMPERYCQSCGMILTPDDCGTDATGAATDHYCKWCYDHGQYTYDTTMEAMIEDCAPRLAQNTGHGHSTKPSRSWAPSCRNWSAGAPCRKTRNATAPRLGRAMAMRLSMQQTKRCWTWILRHGTT